jgi:hypothetical protein
MLMVLAGCASREEVKVDVQPGLRTQASVEPILLFGDTCPAGGLSGTQGSCNPTCADLGYVDGYKVDWGGSQLAADGGTHTFNLDDYGHTVTVTTTDGVTFSWTSNFGIDVVLAKGSNASNEYVYSPESKGDTNLHPPINASGGPAAISHLDFCFDYELDVKKTASTHYTRSSQWTVKKTGSDSNLTLSTGETYLVNYTVDVTKTTTDSDFGATGTITIANASPYASAVGGIVEDMCGTTPAVDCGQPLPLNLAPGQTVTCSYAGALPSATSCTNNVTVSTIDSPHVGGGSASAAVTFGAPTSLIDDCVSVDDNRKGNLGSTCAATSYTYTLPIRYDVCGDYTYDNTASFTTSDTHTTASSSWTVSSHLDCNNGCTLTWGYWKTHSSYGPAPYDDTWAKLPQGIDTPFFASGATYKQVLDTSVAGNAYYNLAHQWIAAQLNLLNGASMDPASQAAYASAQTILASNTPAQIGALKKSSSLYTQVIALAGALAAYNQGDVGPGHCSQ